MSDPVSLLIQNPMVALMVAAFVIIFREVISAVKGLIKASPADKIVISNEKLAETLTEITMNLKILNAAQQSHAEVSAVRQKQILDEIKAVRAKVNA